MPVEQRIDISKWFIMLFKIKLHFKTNFSFKYTHLLTNLQVILSFLKMSGQVSFIYVVMSDDV